MNAQTTELAGERTQTFERGKVDYSRPCSFQGCTMCLGHPGRHSNAPEIRIKTNVPEKVLERIAGWRGKYSDLVHIFHIITLDVDSWIGVAGDGNNGSYEFFALRLGKFECSECGYGSPEWALRDALNKYCDE